MDSIVKNIVDYCEYATLKDYDNYYDNYHSDIEVDIDFARELLDGDKDVDNLNDFDKWSELSWYLQKKQGEAAKLLNYKAAETTDEQGCLFIVNMTDRLDELKLEYVEQFSKKC